MLLRIRVGVQLDADMILGPHCDKLFDAAERETTAEHPYPILPVHWMTRFKDPSGKQVDWTRYMEQYATEYPGDNVPESLTKKVLGLNIPTSMLEVPTQDLHFPPRIRWAHAHPTWSFHALPFIADALLCKLDPDQWQASARVAREMGVASPPKLNPRHFMAEDGDLLNILLWRYKRHKQWCKWDLEPDLYQGFLDDYQKTLEFGPTWKPSHGRNGNWAMSDRIWYPDGIPLVFLAVHNTKDTLATDKLLSTILKRGASSRYLYFNGTYYDEPSKLRAGENVGNVPCILV